LPDIELDIGVRILALALNVEEPETCEVSGRAITNGNTDRLEDALKAENKYRVFAPVALSKVCRSKKLLSNIPAPPFF